MAASMTPADLRLAGSVLSETLRPALEADWSRKAGGLDWDCRATLEHVGFAMERYALYLAGPWHERLPFQLAPHPDCTIEQLIRLIELRAAVLSEVARAAGPEVRGYHVYGRPDASGYIAMGCIETLVHTDDMAQGLGLTYTPPSELVASVLARLFPWAPQDVAPWESLQWVTGRLELPGRGRVAPDWAWHASPISEWDGTVKTQASYR